MGKSMISQAEARRLKRRVEQLEAADVARRNQYARDYPGGVNIAQHNYVSSRDYVPAVIANSRLLGHAVVCVTDGATVLYYALPYSPLPR